MSERAWHQHDIAVALERLQCAPGQGLSNTEADRRRQEHGLNVLDSGATRKPLRILWDQLVEPMVLLLLLAAGISFMIGESTDAIVILIIVVINTALGFIQDFRAEKAMAALIQRTIPSVLVRRNGETLTISADQLVPGDIMLLEAGNRVPADGRILESHRLRISEAALTGESAPVDKRVDVLEDDNVGIGDQINMVFMGTDVSAGRAEAVVTETGMRTELGQIAGMMQSIGADRTPLQKRLATLGLRLAIAAIVLVATIFGIGLLQGQDLVLLFMTALSMAVAAVPEGLPAVATVALALGARRMLTRQALVRKLAAVETLGSVSVICCDKTGTLTENRMQVTDCAFPESEPAEVSRILEQLNGPLMLYGLASCNDASIREGTGDPTELALLETVPKAGWSIEEVQESMPRMAEFPFDSDRKRMTTVHRLSATQGPFASGEIVAFTKGAVDTVLDVCTHKASNGKSIPITADSRELLLQDNDRLASRGMRVLGLAYRIHQTVPDERELASTERDLCFIGMAAMIDPPRAEVKEAVARCRSAGIRPIMITGDHPLTAKAIAAELGFSQSDDLVISGKELMAADDEELDEFVKKCAVFARVSPEHKLRIVRSLKRHGEIVAMTGDGVNDAPSLKEADIGVSMGITGTDVAKEASDMVLLDDHFSTIVNAVEEGRMVYDNIRKFLKYTMTSNAGELWVVLLAPLLGMPLPLLPLQILWINLVTDGLPGLALSVERAERNIMERPPHPVTEPIFNKSMVRHFLLFGLLMGVVPLLLGFHYWSESPTSSYDASWGTIIFTILTLSQMGHALAIRSSHDSLFKLGLFSNKPLVGAIGLTLLLQLVVIYTPWGQRIFHTTALSWSELGICLLASMVVFWFAELEKVFKRRSR